VAAGARRVLAAVDLGAESGRVVVGRLGAERVELELVHRFPNRPLRLPDGLHWNLPGLHLEILDGLARAASRAGALDGIGVDAWGVDYALLDDAGRVLGLPYHYRDGRVSAAVVALAHAHVPQAELYERTGIQFMAINTVYQLAAEAHRAAIGSADRIAMISDLLGYWMTGEHANELTIASTTALLAAGSPRWDLDLVGRLGLPQRPFSRQLTDPGSRLGPLLPGLAPDAGAAVGTPVWTVASHDTASAFVAAPVLEPDAAILSSGTWSLLGLELDEPCLGRDAAAFNLTNERGLDGTIRVLRNVMGLWLLQECRREWAAAGSAYDYDRLHELAGAAPADVPLFDPDHESLLRGGEMVARITAACERAGQPAPGSVGELVRSILVSLACKYRFVLDQLRTATGRTVGVVHAVGGGSRNALLSQLTADLLGIPVLAGPEEAAALGNVLVQARALGELGSLAEIRRLVGDSVPIIRFEPSGGRAADEIYERFLAVTGLRPGRAAGATVD
jgi:rhamnulokinase